MIGQRAESMSADCYQTAYDCAISEIAAITAQLQRLTRRKEQLEKLVEPLRALVSESGSTSIPAAASNGSEFEAPETAAHAFPFLVSVGASEPETILTENRAPVAQSGAGQPGHHAGRNGRSFSQEDVAELAYRFWSEGGCVHGRHEDDWFRAAMELQNSA
jgi:hypothetical protein